MIEKIGYTIIALLVFTSCLDKPKVTNESELIDQRQESTEFLFDENEDINYLLKFQKENTTASFGFKGEVAKVTQTNYWYKNQNNVIIKVTKKLKTTIYEFNKGRQLVLNNIYADDKELFYTDEYRYDIEGFLTTSFNSNKARFVVKSVPVYSREGIIMKEIHYNSDGIKIGESINDIELSNQTLTKTTTWSHAKSKNKTVNKIDLNGNLISRVYYETTLNKEFNLFAETADEYWYNENNRVIKEKHYTPWGLTNNYKTQLKRTVVKSYKDEFLEKKTELLKGKQAEVYHYTYTFDSKGNWIEKNSFKNGEKESQIVREILYY